jgi:hypothetical protein
MGTRAGLDAVEKRKIPSHRRESNPDRPARSQSLYQLSYPRAGKYVKFSSVQKNNTKVRYSNLLQISGSKNETL